VIAPSLFPATLRRHGWLMLAVVAALLTIGFRLGGLPLINPDEGRNAEVAREMKEQGAWLVPTYNGLTYLDKPAFYFKAVACSLSLLGDTELAARMPSALFAFAILAMVWTVCRRECGERPAALAVLVVATTPLFISQARTVIFDIALALFVGASIFLGYLAEQRSGSVRRRFYLAAAAAAGVATLVKGPVGLVLPLLVLLIFNGVDGRSGAWKRLLSPVNALVFLAVVLPWFAGVVRAHPDFLHYGLVEETLNRFATGKFHRTAPFYYYLLVLPASFFPWSLLLPAGLLIVNRWRTLPPISRLSVVWSVAVVIFFSISQSKLPGYILSVTLPFGILTGQLLDAALWNPAGRAGRFVRGAAGMLAAFVALVALGGIIVAPESGLLPTPLRFPRWEFELGQFSSVLHPLLPVLLLLAGLGAWGWFRSRMRPMLLLFGLLPVALIVLGAGAFKIVYESKSGRDVAARMSPLPPEAQLAFFHCFPAGLPFYLRRTAVLFTNDGSELSSNYAMYALRNRVRWPEGVLPTGQFAPWLVERQHPVYLIVNESERGWLEALAQPRGSTVEKLSRRYYGALLPAAILSAHPRSAPLPLAGATGSATRESSAQ
jgi:Dolichyl-phosphate-mannose-protein mannosyltransferase